MQQSFAEECQSIVTKLSAALPQVEFTTAPQEEINEVLFYCRCIASFNELHIGDLKYFYAIVFCLDCRTSLCRNEGTFSLYNFFL